MTSYILLENIRFFAYHGVAPQETTVGNEFVVSLRLKTDIARAMESDDVADTVNYAEIHQAVKEEMDIPSKLLEHVAGRIVRRLFNDFPPIVFSSAGAGRISTLSANGLMFIMQYCFFCCYTFFIRFADANHFFFYQNRAKPLD